MSSQSQRFHCLAENERFAILSLKFLLWGQNIFAFCPKCPIKIPNFSERQTLLFTSTRKNFKSWLLTKNSLDKSSSTEKSFFFKWILNSKWNMFQFTSLLHEHGRAEGDPLPRRFMMGTEMTPCDFNIWWQLRQSLLSPCPLHGKSQLVHSSEFMRNGVGGGAWSCRGCWSTRAFITTVSTLISGMNFSKEVVCGLRKC